MEDALIGKVLGGYRIERLLVRQRVDTVYRATQLSVARTVALRVLTAEAARDKATAAAFLEGARRAGKLNHPCVVEFHEVRRQGEYVFCSMEYLPGGSLADWVAQRGPLPCNRFLPLILDAVDALLYGESLGYVHGSLDPEHLLFSQDGRLKVLDLGTLVPGTNLQTPLLEKQPVRKIHYIAPEQIRHGQTDTRTDVYSLGCVCHFALSGKHPFGGGSPDDVLATKRLHRAPPLSAIRSDVPREVTSIVQRMMALTPERRFQSFARVKKVLEPISTAMSRDTPKGTRSPGRTPLAGARIRPRGGRSQARRWTFAAGLVLVAGIIVASVLLQDSRQEPLPGSSTTGAGAEKAASAKPGGKMTPNGQTSGGEPSELGKEETEAALAVAIEATREGRHRESVAALKELLAKHESHSATIRQTLERALESAKDDFAASRRLADEQIAREEYEEAEGTLRQILPRLPDSLAREARRKLNAIHLSLGEGRVQKARRAIEDHVVRLDFPGAEKILNEVPNTTKAAATESLVRLRNELGASKALLENLHSAALPEWTGLDERLRALLEKLESFSLSEFQDHVLAVALALYREESPNQGKESLFQGRASFPTPDKVELVYDFSSADQLRDLVPVGKESSSLSREEGALDFAGEYRLLRGSPFRNRIAVSLEILRCNPDTPNINVALWTTDEDRLTHDEEADAAASAPPAYPSADGEGGTLGPVVFCMGYVPVEPIVDSLKVDGSSTRVLFPCLAIVAGRSGKTLHEDLRWDCLWGHNFFSRLRAPTEIGVSWRPEGIEWSLGSRKLAAEVDTAVLDRLRKLAGTGPVGSVTLFTNGERVILGSLTITADIRDEWMEERLHERAVKDLQRLLPGLPWGEG